jgi:hypothetical protein
VKFSELSVEEADNDDEFLTETMRNVADTAYHLSKKYGLEEANLLKLEE